MSDALMDTFREALARQAEATSLMIERVDAAVVRGEQNSQLIAILTIKVEQLTIAVDRIGTTIRGNGSEGLVTKIATLTQEVGTLTKGQEARQDSRVRGGYQIAAQILGVMLSVLLGVLVAKTVGWHGL